MHAGEQLNRNRSVQRKASNDSQGGELAEQINNSPAMVAQRKQLDGMFGAAIQRVEEEEPLQGKFETAQRVEEEEQLQGKFDTAQRVEEEEPLQGKSEAGSSLQLKEEASKPNNTGLPDNLKNGIESLSGMSMDGVKVHYNSSQPAQLNALAYAQGTDIHVAPGQEQHLPHEAWHVVQQTEGRVQPTMQMKDGVPVNDDLSLENEADVMGGKALSVGQRVDEKESLQGKSEKTPRAHMTGQSAVQCHTREEVIRAHEIMQGITRVERRAMVIAYNRKKYPGFFKTGFNAFNEFGSDPEIDSKLIDILVKSHFNKIEFEGIDLDLANQKQQLSDDRTRRLAAAYGTTGPELVRRGEEKDAEIIKERIERVEQRALERGINRDHRESGLEEAIAERDDVSLHGGGVALTGARSSSSEEEATIRGGKRYDELYALDSRMKDASTLAEMREIVREARLIMEEDRFGFIPVNIQNFLTGKLKPKGTSQ